MGRARRHQGGRSEAADLVQRQRHVSREGSVSRPLLPHRLRRHQPDDVDRRRRESRRALLARHELLRRHLLARRPAGRLRAAPHQRSVARRDARETRRLGAARRRLQVPRGVHRQGPRRQDRHLGRHHPADELRPEEEVSGDREHLRRPAQLVRAEDVLAVRPAFLRRQGHRHAGARRDGLHRRADRRHGDEQPIEGVSRRRLEERRRRRVSRIASCGTRPPPRSTPPTTSRGSASTAARPAARTRSAGCCSIPTSTRPRCRSPAATTTAWTRSAGTSSGWASRWTIATANRRTSTTPASCRGRCC